MDGENTITLKTSPMKIHAEVEPVYILGDFSVEPAAKGFILTAPPSKITSGTWLKQGLPFYSWGVTYSKEFTIDKPAGKYEIALGEWKGTVAEVSVNGESAGVIAFPPFSTEVTNHIIKGTNRIDIKVIGSLRNLLGPHHNNPPSGFASPWNWRYVRSYPAGKDYRMYDYGLMDDFILYRGE
jgi:hypothetical protein